ncbi:hypothetical protein INR49_000769 [Caranx melampygus]|nr:hypothetical protein INR49_000769 [Caranx melampygus]
MVFSHSSRSFTLNLSSLLLLKQPELIIKVSQSTHLIFRDAVDAHCGDGCEHNPDGEQAEEFAGDGVPRVLQRGGRMVLFNIYLKEKTQSSSMIVTGQQLSQSGVGEFLQRAGAEAPLQTTDVHVDQDFIRVLVDPAGQTLLHHGNLVTQQRHIVNTETYVEQTK